MASVRHIVAAAVLVAGICLVHADRNARAVNGKPTDIEDAPWLVQFEYRDGTEGSWTDITCAGNILNANQILTAAHCFGKAHLEHVQEMVRVRAGATNKMQGGQVVSVDSVIVHPKFVDGDNRSTHDMAVVNLAEPLQFNDQVQPIEIAPEDEMPVPFEMVTSGGWGTIAEGTHEFADTLTTVKLFRVNQRICDDTISRITNPEGYLCMQPKTGIPCGGDSGTGAWLPAQYGNPAWLVGILRGGTVCRVEDGVALYTSVNDPDVQSFLKKHVNA